MDGSADHFLTPSVRESCSNSGENNSPAADVVTSPFTIGYLLALSSCQGILSPHDAVDAVRAGADGLIVSNHGGRALDGVLSSIESLGPVVKVGGVQYSFEMESMSCTGAKCLVQYSI